MQESYYRMGPQAPRNTARLSLVKSDCSKPGTASVSRMPRRIYASEIYDAFGSDPDCVVRCFVDLGMTDGEIAQYVGLPETRVNLLTRSARGLDVEKYFEQR